jgi:hypothetical protein
MPKELKCNMNSKYINQYIPKALQLDFVDNRVIPFVGAGFSKNALLPNNKKAPNWDELGRIIAEFIPDYEYKNAIDALSLFESEFSRAKLIELVAKILMINDIKPGQAHQSFVDVIFATICTTNFDFLIEQALNMKNIPFSTIVSEDRLPIDTHEQTKLIKIHGDFNHPSEMVITENDYDMFIERNKIYSTYISNLFITKTILLIGYSFDDDDIRSLWNIIGNRLGKISNPAYVVLVDANPIEISRFARRNIKVINLQGSKENYLLILSEFFKEIKSFIYDKTKKRTIFTSEIASEEKKMPAEDNQLCFISAPDYRISFLKTLLYPTLINAGLSPVSLDEAIVPGGLLTRKIDTLINQSSIVIVDQSDNNTNVSWELDNILAKGKKTIQIIERQQFEFYSNNKQSMYLPQNLTEIPLLVYSLSEDNSEFILSLNTILDISLRKPKLNNIGEPKRLLAEKEYEAAVILAFRLLETVLRERFCENIQKPSLYNLHRLRSDIKDISELINRTNDYRQIRNSLVHTDSKIDRKLALQIVEDIEMLNKAISSNQTYLEKDSYPQKTRL